MDENKTSLRKSCRVAVPRLHVETNEKSRWERTSGRELRYEVELVRNLWTQLAAVIAKRIAVAPTKERRAKLRLWPTRAY